MVSLSLALTIFRTCSGDSPLSEALHVMNNEGVSSIVVVDNHMNVLGNISTADVKVGTDGTPWVSKGFS